MIGKEWMEELYLVEHVQSMDVDGFCMFSLHMFVLDLCERMDTKKNAKKNVVSSLGVAVHGFSQSPLYRVVQSPNSSTNRQ